MASRLDQALDEVIKERRSERSSHHGGRRHNDRYNDRDNRPRRDDFTRRRHIDNDGVIRKRVGPSSTISSFVRTANVGGGNRGNRNVDGQWSHDMFDDGDRSIISRLGGRRSDPFNRSGSGSSNPRGHEISIENLHYDVTEKDLQELFSTVADVLKAKLVFDPSGRSTGVAIVKYGSIEDAEKAIKKYNNVELDGQAMKIELKEYVPRERSSGSGGRFNNSRLDRGRNTGRYERPGNRGSDRDRRNNGGRSSSARESSKREEKKPLTAEDLDKEMDSYMSSNVQNEDTDMILD